MVHKFFVVKVHETAFKLIGVRALGRLESVAAPDATKSAWKVRFDDGVPGPVCFQHVSTNVLTQLLSIASKSPAHSTRVLTGMSDCTSIHINTATYSRRALHNSQQTTIGTFVIRLGAGRA